MNTGEVQTVVVPRIAGLSCLLLIWIPHFLFSQERQVIARASVVSDTISMPFRTLTIEDGLSQGMVNCILQDQFGYMWFATKDGLNRYDGYSFRVFRHDPADSNSVRENFIYSISEDSKGRLWVGTSSGLDVYNPFTESFIHVPINPRGENCGAVLQVVEDGNGDVWVGTTLGLVKITFLGLETFSDNGFALPRFTAKWYFKKSTTIRIDKNGVIRGNANGYLSFSVQPLHSGAEVFDTLRLRDFSAVQKAPNLDNLIVVEDTTRNRMYATYVKGILEFDARGNKYHGLFTLPEVGPSFHNNSPIIDEKGRIWIAEFSGLYVFDPAANRMSRIRASDMSQQFMVDHVKSVYCDRSGLIWIGTGGYGVLQYDPRSERFNPRPDMSSGAMHAVRYGLVTVARTGMFISVYDPKSRKYIVEVSEETARSSNQIHSDIWSASDIIQDEDGVYWMNVGGLISFDANSKKITRYIPHDSSGTVHSEGATCFPLHLNDHNELWFGGDSAFWRFDKKTLNFKGYTFPIDPFRDPYPFLQVIHEDRDGVFWLGTMKGILRFDPRNDTWKHYTNVPDDPSTLAVEMVFSIEEDPVEPDHVLWVGTNGGGLNRFDKRTGKVVRYATIDGLPNDVVYGILTDEDGNLWLSTNKGISRFDPRTESFRNFLAGDGLQSDEFNRYAYCKLKDGTLFFGGVNGFNSFKPRDLREDSRPVDVRITEIRLMNRTVVFGRKDSPLFKPSYLSEGMEIPYSANMVTFQFASMDFTSPRQRRYRYRLSGFDPDWIESGTSNIANYTNLDPGTYTFQVTGCNRDGVWGDAVTSFKLVVLPPWWMTWWFYSLCIAAGAGSLLMYIRSLRQQRDKLERTVYKRTIELSKERDRSDELLHNILPYDVAEELKAKGSTKAREFDLVTILFTDFKGFTELSEQMTPAELVDELNVCFKAFDEIVTSRGIEKIKTIGDAYMAAGGLPDPASSSPRGVVEAAIDMQNFMTQRRKTRDAEGKPAFDMRLGIHSGPVVAGIVGVRKFAYDIWGDTVNVASRMESSGEVGKVNISEATYRLIKDEPGFTLISRGMIAAKGKGELEMFFVERS